MMTKLTVILFFLLLAPFLASCGLKDSQNIQTTLCGGSSVDETFSKSLHPLFQPKCVSCHGNGTAPEFAKANLKEAQDQTILRSPAIVNFESPGESRLVKKMEELHNCGTECGKLANDFKDAITAWAAERLGDKDCGPPAPDTLTAFHVTTSAKPFANTVSATADTITRWNISTEVPALTRTQMEVIWRLKNAPSAGSLGSFEIRGIRVGSQDAILRVRKLRVLQNGTQTQSLNFSFADQNIANLVIPINGVLPFPLLGIPGSLNIPITETVTFKNASDNIAIYFDILAPTSSVPDDVPVVPTPGNLTEPQRYELAHNVLRLRCLSCHNSQSAYRINGIAADDKPATVARINRTAGQQANSLLLQKGAGQVGHGGGAALALNGNEYNIILTWIQTAP